MVLNYKPANDKKMNKLKTAKPLDAAVDYTKEFGSVAKAKPALKRGKKK